MTIQTQSIRPPRIVLAGLPAELSAGLQQRIAGASFETVATTQEAADRFSQGRPTLLIVNHTLTGIPATDIVTQLRRRQDDVPVVYLLDNRLDSRLGRQLLMQLGIDQVLVHPVDADEVARRVAALLQRGVPLEAPEHDPGATSTASRNGGARDVATPDSSRMTADHLAAEPTVPQMLGAEGEARASLDHAFLLIVDSAAEITERIASEAKLRGLQTEIAPSIGSARQALTRLRPDVVLIDLAMCNASDECLALMEELDDGDVPIPVLFLAEQDTFIDRMQAASLGGRGFVPKTFPPLEVLRAVTRLLQQLHSTDSRVLVVDSDPAVLEELKELLQSQGATVVTLAEPLKFWNVLEQVVPDLLILDFDLPRWSGLELCRVVRGDTRWSALPVVFLTTSTDSDTVQRLFDAGADDFVSKPVVGQELVTKVINRLQRMQLYRTRAETDPLTGVANRLKGAEELDHLLRLAKRQRQALSVAVLDLDEFKQINDRFGHGIGDDALRRFGSVLARTFRSEDVVSRWGGEEFVVGLYGMPRSGGVQRLRELLTTLSQETPARLRDAGLTLTFSAGVAQYPEDGNDVETLIEAADMASISAKQAGKNRVLPAGTQRGEQEAHESYGADVAVVAGEPLGRDVVEALDRVGYRIRWLKDGETASLKLGGPDPTMRTQVIVLDLEAPILDGMSVLRRLSRDGVLAKTRVIVLAGPTQDVDLHKAKEMGAFDHVVKPFRLPVLLQRVRQAMEVS